MLIIYLKRVGIIRMRIRCGVQGRSDRVIDQHKIGILWPDPKQAKNTGKSPFE